MVEKRAKAIKRPKNAKGAAKKTTANKVDYYPNRVPFLVAVAAVSILVLLAAIAAL